MPRQDKYQGRIKFGLTTFNRPIPDEQEDKLFTDQLRNLFKSQKWTITQSTLPIVCSIVNICPAIQFNINNHCRSSIIKDISNIQFTLLKQLNASWNRIVSLEDLQYINSPLLQKLNLSYNKISSIRSLRKAIFPNLKKLVLYSNFIIDMSPLSQIRTHLHFTNFHIEEFTDTSILCEDIKWLAKMYPNQILFCQLVSNLRIKQSKIASKLKKKYCDIEILSQLSQSENQSESSSDNEINNNL